MHHKDFNVCAPYTPAEMDKLFQTYVSVSEDSITGTSQNGMGFWVRIINTYNANRLDRTREHNASMFREAFGRAEEIQKF